MTKPTKKPTSNIAEKRWVRQLTWLAVVAVVAALVFAVVRILR